MLSSLEHQRFQFHSDMLYVIRFVHLFVTVLFGYMVFCNFHIQHINNLSFCIGSEGGFSLLETVCNFHIQHISILSFITGVKELSLSVTSSVLRFRIFYFICVLVVSWLLCALLGCVLVLLFALYFLWMASHPCFFIYWVFLLPFFFNFLKRNAGVGLPRWSSS